MSTTALQGGEWQQLLDQATGNKPTLDPVALRLLLHTSAGLYVSDTDTRPTRLIDAQMLTIARNPHGEGHYVKPTPQGLQHPELLELIWAHSPQPY